MANRTPDYIQALSEETLRAIVASTNPNGKYRRELTWAKQELDDRAEKEPRK